MRSFRQDIQAASEIVGTLLLMLLVVGAIASLAVFVQQKQEHVQAQQQVELDRDLERLDILSIVPRDTNGTGSWDELEIVVVGVTVQDRNNITGVLLNDLFLRRAEVYLSGSCQGAALATTFDPSDPSKAVAKDGGWQRLDEGAGGSEVRRHGIGLGPLGRACILVHLTAAGNVFGPPAEVGQDQIMQVTLLTQRANRFERAFLPPTAIGLVDSATGTTLLDGQHSDHADEKARIHRWDWHITSVGADCDPGCDVSGRIVAAPFSAAGTYTITLSVTDNFGMKDSHIFTYVQP